jgi:integrase
LAVYKRGKTYYYEFQFNGHRIQQSAQTGNKEAARQIEAAHRTRLAKCEAGIEESKPMPTLKEFAPRFAAEIETVCADKPATVGFYKEKLRRLLEDSTLAGARLDAIDKAMIDAYKHRRSRKASRYGRPLAPASVNRELACLRRLLRLAQEWKQIPAAPKIRLLRGERTREFVLSHRLQPKYLEACPSPLDDVATLMFETGVRPGEAVNLRWTDVYLNPAVHARLGYIAIREGKSDNAKRNLSLTAPAAEMLKTRATSKRNGWVFPGGVEDAPVLGTYLDRSHDRVRESLKLPKDFVLHSLRHTMLTRLGESGAEAFTIMKIAGHSSVTVSQRYMHPTPEGMERAFERLQDLNATKFAETGTESARVPAKVPTTREKAVASKVVSQLF